LQDDQQLLKKNRGEANKKYDLMEKDINDVQKSISQLEKNKVAL
tara:strand:- start:907 stop:1038 length:132 start_codon:yes stop_codon:yes gene_type:complete